MNPKTDSSKRAPLVRLGELIEVFERRNLAGLDLPFYGINKEKDFMPTVADTNELDNKKYKIVGKNMFAFSGMQTGRDVCIRIAFHDEDVPILISPAYTTFVVKYDAPILPKFLFLFFKRFEMDRYGWFLSDGSIRSNLDWGRFLEIQIPLPSIEVQRELVAIYEGCRKIVDENLALIAHLERACHAFVVDCKSKYPPAKLGDLIEISQKTNIQNLDLDFLGINREKEFMPTVANTEGLSKNKYLILEKGLFVFSGMQTGRDVCIRIGLYNEEELALISPAYTTFRVSDEDKILPEFLIAQFKREEMDRMGWFKSDGSIRSNLDWERFCEIQIPLPPREVQESIVSVYHCIEEAKRIVREMRERMEALCPALVQKAAHAA